MYVNFQLGYINSWYYYLKTKQKARSQIHSLVGMRWFSIGKTVIFLWNSPLKKIVESNKTQLQVNLHTRCRFPKEQLHDGSGSERGMRQVPGCAEHSFHMHACIKWDRTHILVPIALENRCVWLLMAKIIFLIWENTDTLLNLFYVIGKWES